MHSLTPLGVTMHLKELDRQAAPKLRSLGPTRQDASGVRLNDSHKTTIADDVVAVATRLVRLVAGAEISNRKT